MYNARGGTVIHDEVEGYDPERPGLYLVAGTDIVWTDLSPPHAIQSPGRRKHRVVRFSSKDDLEGRTLSGMSDVPILGGDDAVLSGASNGLSLSHDVPFLDASASPPLLRVLRSSASPPSLPLVISLPIASPSSAPTTIAATSCSPSLNTSLDFVADEMVSLPTPSVYADRTCLSNSLSNSPFLFICHAH